MNANEIHITIPHTTQHPINLQVRTLLRALADVGYAPTDLILGTRASIVYFERVGVAVAKTLSIDFIKQYGRVR